MHQPGAVRSSMRSPLSLLRAVTLMALLMMSASLPASGDFVASADTGTSEPDEVCGDPVAVSARMPDVSPTSTHATAIECMARYGVIRGYEDGTFGPEDRLTRGQMASMLNRFLSTGAPSVEVVTRATPFIDISGNVHADGIAVLYALGITTGVTETEYVTGATLTRAQMATFVLSTLRAAGLDFDPTSSVSFPDVSAGSPHRDAIETLAGESIIRGVSSDSYAPDRPLERQQAASLLLRSAVALHAEGLWDATPPEGAADVVADVVLSGDYPDGVTVPSGQTAAVDGLVITPKNVVVNGTLVMRPGSHLKFRDVDMTSYVGAGDHAHQPVMDSDVGLWVTGDGVLDLAGTPKQGWNRTGSHPTWSSSDEYWISPTKPGDFDPLPWRPGDAIPRFDPRVPAAEVMNVTRDVVIEGPAHIHVHSHKPQRIEYVQLRSMGVSNKAHEGPVLGRYALHVHHGEDGTRGTIIRGVAAINSKGRVFVPHQSHGITMRDNVSVNSYAEVLWWDKGDKTKDLTVDGLAASGVHMPRAVAGRNRNLPVVALKSNDNAAIRNSAVSGARGSSHYAYGFHWNTKGAHTTEGRAVWDFENNLSHNNEGPGLRFWFNENWPHHVRSSSVYNNGGVGIENGAYKNSVRYSDMLVLNNASGGILHHTSSFQQYEDGGPGRYRNVTVEGPGTALEIGKMQLPADNRQEFIDCQIGDVLLDANDKTGNPFIALFRNCGELTPDDVTIGGDRIAAEMDGTSIIIEHPDGRSWEITVQNGTKMVNKY